MSEVKTFADMARARRAVEGLKTTSGKTWRSTGAWDLAQMLNHAAQSIEYSLHGFPQMKPALFRHTAGRVGFALFDARGAMSHGLDEPIPGAPMLARGSSVDDAVERMLRAMSDFEKHTGPLAPHFAYGTLDKAQFTRAHLMHLANHWTEVVPS